MAGQKKDPWAQFGDAPATPGDTMEATTPNSSDPFGNFADAGEPTAQPMAQTMPQQPATPKTGAGDAALGGWKSGALLGFDDEIGGAGAGAGNWLVNNVLTTDTGQKFAPYIAALLGKGYDPSWRFNNTGQTDAQAYEAERAKDEATKNQQWQEHPLAFSAGFAPGLIGSARLAPFQATKVGNLANWALGGALSGAANAQPGDRLEGGALGGVEGAVGGTVLNKLAQGAGNVISPMVAPAIRRLQAAGVDLTPGQILGETNWLGQGLRGIEDKSTSIPITGNVINAAKNRATASFNRAAINQVLAPISQTLPNDVPVGRIGVKYAGDQLSSAYDKLLPKLSAKADNQFMTDLADVAEMGTTMVGERAAQLDKIMQNDVGRFIGEDGSVNGLALKEIESRLGARVRKMGSSLDADQRDMADALRAAQEAVRDLAARSNPKYADELSKINTGWAMLTRLEAAAAKGSEEGFTPKNLQTAVRTGDRSVRKRAYARGDALMQQFADDAVKVLPSTVPNSGSADRLLNATPQGLAAAAATLPGAIPYTKTGGKVAEWLLTGRQGPKSQALANMVRNAFTLGRNPAIANAKTPGIGGRGST